MSKSVRLREHLAAEVERLAAAEKRSLAMMVEILLEQALGMGGEDGSGVREPRRRPPESPGDTVALRGKPDAGDVHVRTDFK